MLLYFNTSHVTVYPAPVVFVSCFIQISIHLMLRFIEEGKSPVVGQSWFQYISCYGLSGILDFKDFTVILFQYISCYGLSLNVDILQFTMIHFNTSHVTVYLDCQAENNHCVYSFQYISCYGLSRASGRNKGDKNISIHLMLRFIRTRRKRFYRWATISIHLMLRFIVSL